MSLGTFFARDVDTLADFYELALGLAQTVDDSPRCREVSGGGASIGLAHAGAHDLLNLAEDAAPSGLRSMLTFLLPDADDPAARKENAAAIHRAYREIGFFYVSGQGVDPALVTAAGVLCRCLIRPAPTATLRMDVDHE